MPPARWAHGPVGVRSMGTQIDFDKYFMNIALAVRSRANCLGRKVGAALVVKNRIVSTGYNGVPQGMKNCEDGGCDRCVNRESGKGYDNCICVHAEDNALLTAARFGIAVEGGTIYSTLRPCFTCMKALHQAGIRAVYYLEEWQPGSDFLSQYRTLAARFPSGVKQLKVKDRAKRNG
jgi:dCMP deaminase